LDDKRKRKRKAEKNEITIERIHMDDHSSRKKIHYTLASDISLTGLKFTTDAFLPINHPLKIRLKLAKTGRIIEVLGRVKWVKRVEENDVYETGLEFENTPQESILTLMEHIYGELSVS